MKVFQTISIQSTATSYWSILETVGRRSERIRKVSEKMAVVDSDFRQHVRDWDFVSSLVRLQAVLAHLEELENDFTDLKADGSDEEFDFEDEECKKFFFLIS